jgi:hypothetical protein
LLLIPKVGDTVKLGGAKQNKAFGSTFNSFINFKVLKHPIECETIKKSKSSFYLFKTWFMLLLI